MEQCLKHFPQGCTCGVPITRSSDNTIPGQWHTTEPGVDYIQLRREAEAGKALREAIENWIVYYGNTEPVLDPTLEAAIESYDLAVSGKRNEE